MTSFNLADSNTALNLYKNLYRKHCSCLEKEPLEIGRIRICLAVLLDQIRLITHSIPTEISQDRILQIHQSTLTRGFLETNAMVHREMEKISTLKRKSTDLFNQVKALHDKLNRVFQQILVEHREFVPFICKGMPIGSYAI